MKVFTIIRVIEQPEGVFGLMVHENRLVAGTLELPWRFNQRNVSCIPEGKYRAVPHSGGRNGDCYELTDVKGRSDIQIHAGNRIRDIEGCILLGTPSPMPEPGVWKSRTHLGYFLELSGGEPVIVDIRTPRGL